MFTKTETKALIDEMKKGYHYEDYDVDKTLSIWFPIWKKAVEKNREMRSRDFLSCFNPAVIGYDYFTPFNWIGDLELAFLNAGKKWAEQRIEFCTTMLESFEPVASMQDCRSNLADLYYYFLDKKTEADALYEEIVKEDPSDVSGWANYARLYARGSASDREKACTIYKRGIEAVQEALKENEKYFEEARYYTHIEILYDELTIVCKSLGRDEEAAEWAKKTRAIIKSKREWQAAREPRGQKFIPPSRLKQETVIKGPKVGRNAPCPCGSGKKYKKCCLNKVS